MNFLMHPCMHVLSSLSLANPQALLSSPSLVKSLFPSRVNPLLLLKTSYPFPFSIYQTFTRNHKSSFLEYHLQAKHWTWSSSSFGAPNRKLFKECQLQRLQGAMGLRVINFIINLYLSIAFKCIVT